MWTGGGMTMISSATVENHYTAAGEEWAPTAKLRMPVVGNLHAQKTSSLLPQAPPKNVALITVECGVG